MARSIPPAARLLKRSRRWRIWEMTLAPGESYPMHEHRYPYLSVILEGTTVVMTDPRGEEERLRLRPGDVVYRVPPDTHAVRNVGRRRFRNRLIELID